MLAPRIVRTSFRWKVLRMRESSGGVEAIELMGAPTPCFSLLHSRVALSDYRDPYRRCITFHSNFDAFFVFHTDPAVVPSMLFFDHHDVRVCFPRGRLMNIFVVGTDVRKPKPLCSIPHSMANSGSSSEIAQTSALCHSLMQRILPVILIPPSIYGPKW